MTAFLRQWLRNLGRILVFLAGLALWMAPPLVVQQLYGYGWFMLVLLVEAVVTMTAVHAWVES